MNKDQKTVVWFNEVTKKDIPLVGGKGANLGEMSRIGVPVPPGLTITTRACNAYLDAGEQFPEGLVGQLEDALAAIEASLGKEFGSADSPLLVSCRSGAKFSMPGMMDTVLNIGINDSVIDGMAEAFGDELAMVFLPGEVVIDYTVRLKRELKRDRLWVTAYANDVPCYIPSRRILKEGGYEVDSSMISYARPARLAPTVEDQIIATVKALLPESFRL